MIFYRPVGTFVWNCKGCLTYACCNSLLCPVDVQYSTKKHWGNCCVLRPDQTADLNHSIRPVSILNPNKTLLYEVVLVGWLCLGYSFFSTFIGRQYFSISIHNYDVLFAIIITEPPKIQYFTKMKPFSCIVFMFRCIL